MKNITLNFNEKIIKYLAVLILSLSLFSPIVAEAALTYNGLVKCDGAVSKEYDKNGVATGNLAPGEEARNKPCDFAALMDTINYIIKWVFGLTIPIFIGMCAYAGILYMTPNSTNRASANKMLWTGIKGFILMLSAWFIVSTLVDWLVAKDFKGAAKSLLEQKK